LDTECPFDGAIFAPSTDLELGIAVTACVSSPVNKSIPFT
jgi:hypothetical protein